MKDIFAGYYQPTNDEFKNIWATCIFVFDANVSKASYPELLHGHHHADLGRHLCSGE